MILVHGHRGAKACMPENTLAGFEYAIQVGVDALELDVVVTQEGELVVSHNPVRKRTQEPFLEDVFALAGHGSFSYDVEIKTWSGPWPCPAPKELATRVLEKIRAHLLEKRVTVMSFDFRVLEAMRALAPEIRLAALTATDPHAFSEIAREASAAEVVAPHLLLVTPEKVAAAHAADIQIVPWTVNSPDWDRILAAQVDGIITDDPSKLLRYLERRGLR